jgi:hypothetical protein
VTARARAGAGVALTVLALAALQVVLATYDWLPELDLARMAAPSWDLVVVVALALATGLGRWPRGAVAALLGFLAVFVVAAGLLGFGQGFAVREFGYDVSLALDLQYVPELFHMMWRTESGAWFAFHLACLIVAAGVLIAAVVAALVHLHRRARDVRGRRAVALGVAAYLALGAATLGPSGPLVVVAFEQLDFALHRSDRLREIGRTLEEESRALRRDPLVLGSDPPSIYVIVVESYGQAIFARDDLAGVEAEIVAGAAELATAGGYTIRSRLLRSPVFGGSSWMADATMLCGVKIRNQKRYAALYESDLECLPRTLAKAGYHRVLAAANTTFIDDRFRKMFPFDRSYLRDDFGYVGPRYSWSYVPDQFVLHAVDRLELAPPRDRPVFAFFMLTSSHHPWRKVPAYLERWEDLGDGAIYDTLPAESYANNFVTGEYLRGYAASTRYAMRTVFDYLLRLPAERRPLILVLGDHQPRRPVGDLKHDPWTVPVHVLSRDPALVEGFAALGYAPGIVPVETAGAAGLERLVDHLQAALGAR